MVHEHQFQGKDAGSNVNSDASDFRPAHKHEPFDILMAGTVADPATRVVGPATVPANQIEENKFTVALTPWTTYLF